jgi:hypothetical protein
MSTLSTLKLVASKKHQTVAPIVVRRNKLCAKLHEQIALCEAQKNGGTYAPKRLKTFIDRHSGEKKTIETVKRVKEWFWTSDSGKINLSIKYGSKTLMLDKKKGLNAIELANGDELVKTLALLKTCVVNGDFDEAINEASAATRKAFSK